MIFAHRRSALLPWLALAAGWLAAISTACAQAPASETTQQRATIPGLLSPTTDLPAASQSMGDIKVVDEYPKPEMFSFAALEEFFYTDNVSYTHDNPLGSAAYVGSYTASFVPYSLRDWTPRFTAQYNMFRYDTVPEGDFDNEQLAASSTYVIGEGRDWSWIAGVVASRYTAPHQNDREFYREMIYDNQVQRILPLSSEIPLSLGAAYDIAYHQSSPSTFDYLSNGITLSLVYSPIGQVTIAPYLNPSLRSFFTNTAGQNDREDAHLTEGLDISWQPWEYVALDASIFHVNDFSNNSGLSFNYTIPGLSLAGEVKF